jgi:hypothetical protein
MTTTPRQPPTAGDLTQVRTAADATAWLKQRATEYMAKAKDEPSPDHARGLRLAGSTLEAIAEVSREWRDGITAADGLTQLACCYPEEEIADLPPETRYYQLACRHVADILGQIAAQLTHATAPERARRISVGVSQRSVSRGRDL